MLDHEVQPRIRRRRKSIPVWVWFLVGNIAVVVLLVGGVIAYQQSQPTAVPNSKPVSSLPEKIEVQKPELPAEKLPAEITPSPVAPAVKLSVGEIIKQVDTGILYISTFNAKGDELGIGSGFLIDAQGLVATNFHVIRGASSAKVTTVGGKTLEVRGLRAWDEQGDLAVLELSETPEGLTPLKLSEQTEYKQAAEVIAIGHPQGFKFATTTGIVSAIHQTKDLPQPYRDAFRTPREQFWIQTTAAISQGNSGGPLLDMQGEVVGINTWVAEGENLGFAADVRHLRELQGKVNAEAVSLAEVTGPQEEVSTLGANFQTKYAWYEKEYQAAWTKNGREQIKEKKHPGADFLERFWSVAEKRRQGPAAFESLTWMCALLAMDCPKNADGYRAKLISRLRDDYHSDPRLKEIVFRLASVPGDESREFLTELSNSGSDRDLQASAIYALTQVEQRDDTDPKVAPKRGAQVVALFQRLADEFGDISIGQTKLSSAAQEQLIYFKHLAIGSTAQEIVSNDGAGNSFKLSDYRGKVVVLDFWTNWCPHCVVMYPLERALVKRYADKPFALLGVCCDDANVLAGLQQEQTVTWKNWFDGPQGPIAAAWRVDSYPTLYVLDHKGIVRYRNVRGAELQKAVATLVAEAEQELSPSAPETPKLPETAAVPETAGAAEAEAVAPEAKTEANAEATP